MGTRPRCVAAESPVRDRGDGTRGPIRLATCRRTSRVAVSAPTPTGRRTLAVELVVEDGRARQLRHEADLVCSSVSALIGGSLTSRVRGRHSFARSTSSQRPFRSAPAWPATGRPASSAGADRTRSKRRAGQHDARVGTCLVRRAAWSSACSCRSQTRARRTEFSSVSDSSVRGGRPSRSLKRRWRLLARSAAQRPAQGDLGGRRTRSRTSGCLQRGHRRLAVAAAACRPGPARSWRWRSRVGRRHERVVPGCIVAAAGVDRARICGSLPRGRRPFSRQTAMASFGASSPGSSAATAAKKVRPSAGRPSARWSTPRHHAPASRSPAPRRSRARAGRRRTLRLDGGAGQVRLSSGDRGRRLERGLPLVRPERAMVARTPAAGSVGSTAGTGRNCHGLPSGTHRVRR